MESDLTQLKGRNLEALLKDVPSNLVIRNPDSKILAVFYVFIHDTALPRTIGKCLVLHMVGYATEKDIHDFKAGVLMQRPFQKASVSGKGKMR